MEKEKKGINQDRKNHRETPGFQLVGGEIGCGIYWKDCPVSPSGVERCEWGW